MDKTSWLASSPEKHQDTRASSCQFCFVCRRTELVKIPLNPIISPLKTRSTDAAKPIVIELSCSDGITQVRPIK